MKRLMLLLGILLNINMLYSQVLTQYFTGDEPARVPRAVINVEQTPCITLPQFDVQALLEEDRFYDETGGMPYRFAKILDTSASLSDGMWAETEGGRVWNLKFVSRSAVSISVVFEDIALSPNAELYVTNVSKTVVYGPVTQEVISDSRRFQTDYIAGDEVCLYLFEPTGESGLSDLKINKVKHAYRGYDTFSTENSAPGKLLECHNDIACYPEYETESQAIGLAIIPFNGSDYTCSGCLVMNTNRDFKPYFLTAFHCIDRNFDSYLSEKEKDVSDWSFKFHFKKSMCGWNFNAVTITFNGADFKAGWRDTDFGLLELKQELYSKYNLAWMGWERSTASFNRGTCIHHPHEAVMKISFAENIKLFNEESSWRPTTVCPPNTHFNATFYNGTTQGGSSGSPLLNASRRVVGQLHGGENICPPVVHRFGAFAVSWNGGNTPSTQLKCWLDPTSSNATYMNLSKRGNSIVGNTILDGKQDEYAVQNLPQGATVSWKVTPSDCFSILSVKENKAYLAGHDYNTSGKLEADIIGSDGKIIDRLEKTILTPDLEIIGDQYLGCEYKPYTVNYIPKAILVEGNKYPSVVFPTWEKAPGMETKLGSMSNLQYVRAGSASVPWLSVTVKGLTRYRELSRVQLSDVIVSFQKRSTNKQFGHLYWFDIFCNPVHLPPTDLFFCWNNQNIEEDGTYTPGTARIITAGDIGTCDSIPGNDFVINEDLEIDTMQHPPIAPTPLEVTPVTPPVDPGFILDLPDDSYYSAVVTVGDTYKGIITCTVGDYCGNKFTQSFLIDHTVVTPLDNPSKALSNSPSNMVIYDISPNPAHSILRFSKQEDSSATVRSVEINLYNDYGSVKSLSTDTSKDIVEMNVSDLAEGMYYAVINVGKSFICKRSVIIKR